MQSQKPSQLDQFIQITSQLPVHASLTHGGGYTSRVRRTTAIVRFGHKEWPFDSHQMPPLIASHQQLMGKPNLPDSAVGQIAR